MTHHKIVDTEDITGFSLTAARGGEMVEVVAKGVITSDMNGFFTCIEGVYNIYLRPFVKIEECNQFLILRRARARTRNQRTIRKSKYSYQPQCYFPRTN